MKKISGLVIALIFMLITTNATATLLTDISEITRVITRYNPLGVAFWSQNTTTSEQLTHDSSNSANGYEKTITTQVVESTWKGGSLKPLTSTNTTLSKVGATQDVRPTATDYDSKQTSTDTYSYLSNGYRLTSVSGTGSYEAKEYALDGITVTGKRTGTITRSYWMNYGDPLFKESKTTGDIKDKSGVKIGTFEDKTTIDLSKYEYKGGSYVPKEQSSTSNSDYLSGDYTHIARTVTYDRDTYGVITGIGQTMSGQRKNVTGRYGSQTSSKIFNLTDYKITDRQFHAKEGWFIAEDEYKWVLSP